MGRRRIEGLILEFGVYSGNTINHIASMTPQKVFGFDSFEGLPEDWRADFPKGRFAAALPAVRDNVELVVGWFDATLPGFLARETNPISLLHVDCDLYSSTKTIFDLCRDRIRPDSHRIRRILQLRRLAPTRAQGVHGVHRRNRTSRLNMSGSRPPTSKFRR